MSLYDALSTIYDGVNKNPQDMLLLTLTYLKNISPKQNSDRSIVLARLLDYVTKIEGDEDSQDPAWLTKLLERGHVKSMKPERWDSSRISSVRDRPKIPNAPSLSPFTSQRNKGRRNNNNNTKHKNRKFKSKNPRLLRHKLVPSKLNGNRTIAQKHVVDSPNSPEENGNILLKNKVHKLSIAHLEISKAMSRQTIISAVVDSCQTVFDPVDFVSLYVKTGKTFQSRLPHEKKPIIIKNTKIGIFGQVVKTKRVINLTADIAKLSEHYDSAIDSFQRKPCHILYIPVLLDGSGFFGIIKICKHASKKPFTRSQVEQAICIAKQTAVSLENERIALGSLALSSIVNEISSSLDIADTTLKLCKAAKRYLKCDSAMIFIKDIEKDELSFNLSQHSVTVPIDESSFVGSTAINKTMLNIVKKAQHDIRLNSKVEQLQMFNSTNVMCFPMLDNRSGRVVGVLRVANKEEKHIFTRKDQVLLNGLAQTAMVVLSNARIHDSAVADRVKTDSLLRVAKSLNEQEDLLALIGSIQKEAKTLLECDRISVFLNDSVTGELFTVAINDDGTPFEIRFRSDIGLAGYSFTNSKMINIEDAWEDARFNNAFDKQTGYRTKSVLVVHIVNHVGKNIGVVQCINKKTEETFTKMDELLSDAFASQCAVAIENLRNSERLADLQEYFSQHEASAYDIYFEIDMSRNIVDVSRDAQSVKLFEEENLNLIIGKRIDQWLGKRNKALIEIMLKAFKKPNNVFLKETTFIVPGSNGQTLILDMNIIPVIHKYEKGDRVNEVRRNYVDNISISGHTELFPHQNIGSYLIYCSNMRVKQSSGTIEHVTKYANENEDFEKDITPMLSISLNCSPSLRQKAIVAIVSEIHAGKGFIHHVENNTIVAIFGTPHSTNKDIMNVVDVGRKIVALMEMMQETMHNQELNIDGEDNQKESEKEENNNTDSADIFLSVHVGVTSAKIKIWNRWSDHCRYEAYPVSIAKSHWITEQCYYLGSKFLVDVDIAMHLPTRVVTRKVGTVVWAGDAVDIKSFHHLTPFEQQRAALVYLEKKDMLDMHLMSCEMYEILSEKDLKETTWLRLFDKGMMAFRSQQWSRAIQFFNEVLRAKNDDMTARVYKHISAKLLRTHVSFEGNSWNGIWQSGCERFLLQYYGAEIDREVWNEKVLSYADIEPQEDYEGADVKTEREKYLERQRQNDAKSKRDRDRDRRAAKKEKNRAVAKAAVQRKPAVTMEIDVFAEQEDEVEKQNNNAMEENEEKKKVEKTKEEEQEKVAAVVVVDESQKNLNDGIDWVVERMWKRYSKSTDMDSGKLKVLLETFTNEEGISTDICDELIKSIDGNNNGKIKQTALIKFVHDGLNLSKADRASYTASGDGIDVMLLKFFDSVKEKIIVYHYILEKWPVFDVDNVGYLTPFQTKLFIEMESRNEISKNDCQVFINSIDENQDNQIDQNELIEFILHGLNLNNFQRETYASRGGSQKQVIAFFDAFRVRAGVIPVIPLRDIKDIQDDKLLLAFFNILDTDKSGTISKKELLRAMRKTKIFEGIAKKHNKLRPLLNGKTYLNTFKNINKSGTNEITYEELKEFVSAL